MEKRLGPLPQTEAELLAIPSSPVSERDRKVDPRRRPGRKIPCYWVRIRFEAKVQELKPPHKVLRKEERLVKPKGHTHCKTVQEAWGLANDTAEKLSPDRQVEVWSKMDGKLVCVSIQRGRNTAVKKGMAALEEVVNAGI